MNVIALTAAVVLQVDDRYTCPRILRNIGLGQMLRYLVYKAGREFRHPSTIMMRMNLNAK